MSWDTALAFSLGSLAIFLMLLALVSERHEARLLFAAFVSGVLVILCLFMVGTDHVTSGAAVGGAAATSHPA